MSNNFGPDVYRSKAIITNKRRNATDRLLAAQLAERRIAFAAKLDRIAEMRQAGMAAHEILSSVK